MEPFEKETWFQLVENFEPGTCLHWVDIYMNAHKTYLAFNKSDIIIEWYVDTVDSR